MSKSAGDAGHLPQPDSQRIGYISMAGEAECAQVGQIAFAAAFADRQNVVGVPKTFPADRFQTPIVEHDFSVRTARMFQPPKRFDRIDFAKRAASSIARVDALAKIAGVGSQAPLVHAPAGTKRAAAPWNFDRAPSAQRPPARAGWQLGTKDASAQHGSLCAHCCKRPDSERRMKEGCDQCADPPRIEQGFPAGWNLAGQRRCSSGDRNSTFMKHLLDTAQGLACARFVFNQREPDVAIAMFPEPHSGADCDFRFGQQLL